MITSDLEGFKESVIENVTGLMFKTEEVESLAALMQKILERHPHIYNEIKAKQKEYVEKNLKVDAVVAMYQKMFDSVN